jgi:hypothetical protein
MAIRKWHGGKIVILWSWGIASCVVLIQIIVQTKGFVAGFLLIAALLAVLLSLSVITWKWFGGKEH